MMRKWFVTLEVESHLKPTELAIMVNMYPGVVDCRVADSRLADDPVSDMVVKNLANATDVHKSAPDTPNQEPK